MLGVEDWLDEADDHEAGVGYLLVELDLGVDAELVGPGIIGVRPGDEAVVVDDYQRFVCDLSMSVLEDPISVGVPRIVDVVIVENALLVGHHHVAVDI